ncbi:MAG: Hsp33 family molecular chaperone HslO [Candidatus Kapabacteria bacterium]|nr:Hsp33 family molecular chaperone HslO [Candidatus Kapabacteria bacterium]
MHDDVKKLWKDRDRVVKAMTKDGLFRAAVMRSTGVARKAQEHHGLRPLASLVLTRALTGASLLASFLKGEERITLNFEGDGAIGMVYAEAMQVGEVRGYCRENATAHPSTDSALGTGLLKVQRVLYNNYEPVTGVVALRRGDVTSDLSYYLTQSEQIPSVVIIDVVYDDEHTVREAVGLIVQAMPGASNEAIFKAYDALDYLDRLTSYIDSGVSLEDILRKVLPGDVDVLSSAPVDFFCRCSIDRFKAALLTLGLEEINAMHRDGHHELVCQYCSTQYNLSEQDFAEMREVLLAQRN